MTSSPDTLPASTAPIPPPGLRPARRHHVLPGFGLTLGFALLYLSLIILLPLAAAFVKTAGMTWVEFWGAVSSPRVLASYRLSFGASLLAALFNVPCGLVLAWVLVRYEFPGRRLVNALVDLPFALPTAVAGIALTAIYSKNGWFGQWLDVVATWLEARGGLAAVVAPLFHVAYTPVGIWVALTFIGLPFVVRTVQPVLEELEPEIEEAAATLGATRLQTIRCVVFPALRPAIITGFALAFARAVGEYGSVVFIAGNMPRKTEITPFLIITKLEQFDVRGATALAVVMLVVSFVLLLLVQLAQRWFARRSRT